MTLFRTPRFDPDQTVFEIRDLSVSLGTASGTRAVLDKVSLKIRRGETACLVGESGSGKSVTSLATLGLLPPKALRVTGGQILLGGTDLLTQPKRHLRGMRGSRMSMIFQEPMTALNPVMRVGAQIAEVLRSHGAGGLNQRRRVLEIMEQVHLPDVERIFRSYPHQLSGGQRQRIMIAMALIMEPALLIADEPTTALDVTTQKQILSLIAEMQEKHGTAVMFITHDMGVVAEIADTVHVMRKGRIVESNGAEALFRQPQDYYTRALLRAVPSLHPRPPRPAPEAAVPALSVSGLGKTYAGSGLLRRTPDKHAAEAVSFDLAPGRTLGIVGESGSGKSTVARCVMRLIDPSTGRIRVGGTDITTASRGDLRHERARFQIVFQDPYRSLNPRLRVGESLIEGPVNFGMPRAEALAKAQELLGLVGLPDNAMEAFPHQFSGGQRQRIAIARAVAMEPEVIVADEAVSALDVSVQDQVLKLLGILQERLGIALLFITHDLRVAAQICDDVIVMQHGRVVEQGTAAQVLVRPAHDYTRRLIEAAPGRGWDFGACREIATTARRAADRATG